MLFSVSRNTLNSKIPSKRYSTDGYRETSNKTIFWNNVCLWLFCFIFLGYLRSPSIATKVINLSSISAIFWKTTFKHQTRAIRFCKDPVLQVCFLHPRFVLGKDIELEKRPVVFLDRLARHALAFRLNYHALICGHLGAAVSFTSVKSKHQKLFRKSVTADSKQQRSSSDCIR